MKITNYNRDQIVTIVDEKKWIQTKEKAQLNDQQIEKLASKKFEEYVKNSGVKLSISIQDFIDCIIYHNVCVENNYNERGWNEPINKKLAESIADQITGCVNKKYKDLFIDTHSYMKNELDKYKKRMININLSLLGYGIVTTLIILAGLMFYIFS